MHRTTKRNTLSLPLSGKGDRLRWMSSPLSQSNICVGGRDAEDACPYKLDMEIIKLMEHL